MVNQNKALAGSMLFVFFAAMFGMAYISIPAILGGTTSTQTAVSNATISTYVAITTTFSGGIDFGLLDPGSTDNEATTCESLGCNITVSADTNVPVDVKIKDNAAMTKLGDTPYIGNGNYTWNSTDSTIQPTASGSYAIDTSYDETNKVGNSVAASGKRGITFFIDVPSAQSAGNYNNTLSICADEEDTNNC